MREPAARVAMVQRGLLGGVANFCAFYAVSTLNLGVASCLMFTMPLWTAALAWVFAGQKWERHDVGLGLSCLVGVGLVTELWKTNDGDKETNGLGE